MKRRVPKRGSDTSVKPVNQAGPVPDTWFMPLEEGEQCYNVADSAHDEMIRRGIKLPSRTRREPGSSMFLTEDGTPWLPPNLQDLSDRELGELYGIAQEYFAYVVGQLADTKNRYNVATEKLGFIKARVRIGKDGTTKDKDDHMQTDRRYVTANGECLELECLHNLLAKVADACEADIRLISRNISLKEQGIRVGARAGSIGARRVFGEHMQDSPVPQPKKGPLATKSKPKPVRPALPRKVKR